MAQRSSPILPLTSGIGAVSPVNVGGPGSAEEAFRNELFTFCKGCSLDSVAVAIALHLYPT